MNEVRYDDLTECAVQITHFGIRFRYKNPQDGVLRDQTDFIIGFECLGHLEAEHRLNIYWAPGSGEILSQRIIDLWDPSLVKCAGFREATGENFGIPHDARVVESHQIDGHNIVNLVVNTRYLVCGTVPGIHHHNTLMFSADNGNVQRG